MIVFVPSKGHSLDDVKITSCFLLEQSRLRAKCHEHMLPMTGFGSSRANSEGGRSLAAGRLRDGKTRSASRSRSQSRCYAATSPMDWR